MASGNEKKTDTKRGGVLLRALLRKYQKYLWGASLAALLSSLADMASPLFLAEMTDRVLLGKPSRFPQWISGRMEALSGGSQGGMILLLALCTVGTALLSGALGFLKSRWQAFLGEKAAMDLRNRLYTQLQHLPYSEHAGAQTGDLVQRCTSDVDTVRRFLSSQLLLVISSLSTVVIALYFLFSAHVILALYSLALVPALFTFAWLFFGWVMRRFEKTDEAEGAMSAVLQEGITGVRVVRSFGRQRDEEKKFDCASDHYRRRVLLDGRLMALYWVVTDVISFLQCLITLALCAVYAARGEISVGTAIVFTTYVGRMLWPIRQLGRILADGGKSAVALGRMAQILDKEPEKEEKGLTPDLGGDIEFEHVSFSYGDGKEVLRDLSVTLPGGGTVGILGSTGSGKSTLALLLQRLYPVGEGQIRISGVPLEKIDRVYLRSHVGLVLQEPFLYSRTLEENLLAAAPGRTREEAEAAARDACALDFILESENGWDTLVGERGVTLSGGQKQRMAIARTLLKDNQILIFDDSLSAVDAETDMKIRRALKKRRKGITTLIISHRISTLKEADLILVLEDGRVTQAGTHAELASREGLYRRICGIQALTEE